MKSKMANTQHEKGGKSCQILNRYREILKDSHKFEKIKDLLVTAFENVKEEKEKDLGHLRRQVSMTSFLKKKSTLKSTRQDGPKQSELPEAHRDNVEEEQTSTHSAEPASVALF